MSTAVDTNILLDVLIPDEQHVQSSLQALNTAAQAGALIISEPVYAELASRFHTREELDRFLWRTRVRLEISTAETLYLAGQSWHAYAIRRRSEIECPACGTQHVLSCTSCGRIIVPRQHILSDFLIGAHAFTQAGSLITRDRGYFATYFPKLKLVV